MLILSDFSNLCIYSTIAADRNHRIIWIAFPVSEIVFPSPITNLMSEKH